jgi:hypothetical protein
VFFHHTIFTLKQNDKERGDDECSNQSSSLSAEIMHSTSSYMKQEEADDEGKTKKTKKNNEEDVSISSSSSSDVTTTTKVKELEEAGWAERTKRRRKAPVSYAKDNDLDSEQLRLLQQAVENSLVENVNVEHYIEEGDPPPIFFFVF